jgi:hypothetical protein
MWGYAQRRIKFMNNKKMEYLNNLARINYVIYKLREPMEVITEIYVKWYLTKAFNGFAYKCKNEYGEIIFYLSTEFDGKKDEEQQLIEFNGISVLIRTKLSIEQTTEIVEIANGEFNDILKIEGSSILKKIKRIQIWAIFENDKLSPSETAELIVNTLAYELKGKVVLNNPNNVIWDNKQWEIDGEIILPTHIDEDIILQLINKLCVRTEFNDLLGFGAIISNHEGGNYIQNELKSAHLTGRYY